MEQQASLSLDSCLDMDLVTFHVHTEKDTYEFCVFILTL